MEGTEKRKVGPKCVLRQGRIRRAGPPEVTGIPGTSVNKHARKMWKDRKNNIATPLLCIYPREIAAFTHQKTRKECSQQYYSS